jgi:hypothetical protein
MTVKATGKGYLVTWTGYSKYYNGYMQGSVSGRKVLIHYSASYPRGIDLDAVINDHGTTERDLIIESARQYWHEYADCGFVTGARILSKGHVIQ